MERFILIFLVGVLSGAAIYKAVTYYGTGVPFPVAVLPDGAKYDGDMMEEVIHGNGRMIWANGDRYDGEFRDGLFHGQGRYQFNDGRVYEGEFTRGAMTGTGSMTDPEGNVYTGELKSGMYHGQGSYESVLGHRYTGEFVDGAFTGRGSYSNNEGMEYKGEFRDWVFQGEGELKKENGDRYIGNFEQGSLQGQGEFIGKDGTHYEGGFNYGNYNGRGKLKTAEGDLYDGEFRYGQYHGKGTLTYARAVDDRNKVTGTWKNGELIESVDFNLVHPEQLNEIALYNQNELLHNFWKQLDENDPDNIDMYFLGISGDGTQAVFRREVEYIKAYFDNTFGTRGKSVALINAGKTVRDIPLATTTSIKMTLQEMSRHMDPENDILFIYMTSHGSSEFAFSLDQKEMSLQDISADNLAQILDDLPVRWKVIVISACYSGGFIPKLENDHTLIITAASDDRQSFGCSDSNDFTYFGEAYFRDALPVAGDFVKAFDIAEKIIRQREKQEDQEPSNPQIHKPAAILKHLKQWRSGLVKQDKLVTR